MSLFASVTVPEHSEPAAEFSGIHGDSAAEFAQVR